MRSRVLADELSRRHRDTWAEVAVCRHPGNSKVMTLEEPVAGSRDVLTAFRALFGPDSVQEWDPRDVCRVIAGRAGIPTGWADWMRDRYFPEQDDQSPAGD